MPEITESVTLTNATDEDLVRRGQLASSEVRRLTTDALVNTDIIRSVISKRVAEQLCVGVRNGVASEAILFECLGGQTIDEAVIGEGRVILGRTVVAKLQDMGRIKPRFGAIDGGGL